MTLCQGLVEAADAFFIPGAKETTDLVAVDLNMFSPEPVLCVAKVARWKPSQMTGVTPSTFEGVRAWRMVNAYVALEVWNKPVYINLLVHVFCFSGHGCWKIFQSQRNLYFIQEFRLLIVARMHRVVAIVTAPSIRPCKTHLSATSPA